MAFVLTPESPLADWMPELDAQIERSPSFFAGRPIVLDLSAVPEEDPGMPTLFQEMQSRGIRVIGAEGANGLTPAMEAVGGPLIGGRPVGLYEVPDDPPDAPPPPEPSSLILDEPIRSGQTILFPKGDIIVNGAVAWGAEVLAGGSIHVYGALRGRAIAGLNGAPDARIFCHRMEAELISIDGLYMTADDMEPHRGRAVQARLVGESILISDLT